MADLPRLYLKTRCQVGQEVTAPLRFGPRPDARSRTRAGGFENVAGNTRYQVAARAPDGKCR